jgi:hypothetical protein
MTKEEALKEGYLSNEIVYLRPIPRGGNKAVKNDIRNVALFQFTGAVTKFELRTDDRGTFKNPFKDEKEKKFFEDYLNLNLSVYDTNASWKHPELSKQLMVTIRKDESLMREGHKFDLSDPWQNLQYRIVMSNSSYVSPSWESRFDLNELENIRKQI